MRRVAKTRRLTKEILSAISQKGNIRREVEEVMVSGKRALDECVVRLGKLLAESLLHFERESLSGSEYYPTSHDLIKGGHQGGSVYLGSHKVRVKKPRLRADAGEINLRTYEKLKNPGQFSEELLIKSLRGLSGRKYRETVTGVTDHFGISPSSVSNRLIEATTQKLKDLRERDLSSFKPFALFLDSIHQGETCFMVALGIDEEGHKQVLGFLEGSTENNELAHSFLTDMERRGLRLTQNILFITDGGRGIIRSLKDSFGENLIHQRCTVHKDRNLQRHLPKKYRDEAQLRFRRAVNLKSYEDAKVELNHLETWLGDINESAANSLLEAKEELLTLHKLKAPHLLRKSLHSTNPIESIFSPVSYARKNLRNLRCSNMSQRWIASLLLYAEEGFRRVRGYRSISEVTLNIKLFQNKTLKKEVA